ncbi:MAG: hypothetical protein JW860_03555 [Sedimentisphaerales bacterium]|nr:hypothetical protein [Sedimentisphaerales bacterium]
MHLAIGHYSIGSYDGVNTVIWRTVNELQRIDPNLQITLFGKATPDINHFLPWKSGKLAYRNIEEISPDYRIPGLEGKSVQIQRVHDYIWHGTNVAERLQQQFADVDIVLMENLSVGINPAITYAFYLWSLWEYQAKSDKRFLVRVHDFAQQRPANFSNIKKFQAFLPNDMPDWHQILYPSTPNVEYIAINTYDYYRLMDHGVESTRVWYVPNSIDNSLVRNGMTRRRKTNVNSILHSRFNNQYDFTEFGEDLRRQLENKRGLPRDAAIIYYPVRAIPRKNVEEAIFLVHLLNNLAKNPEYSERYDLEPNYHLVVSLGGGSEEEKQYTRRLKDFIQENHLPVIIDISDLVGLHREYDPENPHQIIKYGVVDMYSISRMTVSTSLMEGFGFVFIEPWAAQQCIIGRNIPSVTMDFVKSGLSLDHLYSVLLVNGLDFADIGRGSSASVTAFGTSEPDSGLELRLQEIKKLENPEYLQKILDKNNASLKATLRLFRCANRRNPRKSLITMNRRKVVEHYSSKQVVSKLYRIMQKQEPPYIDPVHSSQHFLDTPLPANGKNGNF